MIKSLKVKFPFSIAEPGLLYDFSLKQTRYEHDYACLYYKDWNVSFDDVRPMSPVEIEIQTLNHTEKRIVGYVHHLKPIYAAGERSLEIHVIGASYLMKNRSQATYTNVTADQVLKKIARKYSFSYFVEPHERVFPLIAQAGRTDWQLLVWLAKKVGYTLRAENTSLYFYPLSQDYSENLESAPIFSLSNMARHDSNNAYSFRPLIGESLQFDDDNDSVKSAISFNGVDRFAQIDLAYAKQKGKKTSRSIQTPEQFDRFAIATVVSNSEDATWEAQAAEERQRFGYRGYTEVVGNSSLRPDMPIYMDKVGKEYSGFWIVLSVEHKIERAESNTFIYTSDMYIGTDSLGKGSTVPSVSPKRSIKPNVRNTRKKDVSKLKVKGFYNKKTVGTALTLKNKKTPPRINNSSSKSPTWGSSVKDLKQEAITPKYKPAVVIKRLFK